MKHTPEPWLKCTYHQGGIIISTDENPPLRLLGRMGYDADRDRTIQCVNACAGIENPEEAIREAREALDGLLSLGKRDLSNPKYEGYFTSAKNALAKLQPKQAE